MTGKTLTINDLMKVPVAQAAKVVVPAQVVERDEEDLSLLDLLEMANQFIANVNRMIDNAKELIANLAESADKLMLPPGIAEKLAMFRQIQGVQANVIQHPGTLNKEQILRILETLPIPDDASWKEVKEFAKKVLGGGNEGTSDVGPGRKEG